MLASAVDDVAKAAQRLLMFDPLLAVLEKPDAGSFKFVAGELRQGFPAPMPLPVCHGFTPSCVSPREINVSA